MNVAQRLAHLSGLTGVSAGAHLLAIRLGGTSAGAMLVSRSGLPSGTAEQHLLADSVVTLPDSLMSRGFMVNMGTFMSRM